MAILNPNVSLLIILFTKQKTHERIPGTDAAIWNEAEANFSKHLALFSKTCFVASESFYFVLKALCRKVLKRNNLKPFCLNLLKDFLVLDQMVLAASVLDNLVWHRPNNLFIGWLLKETNANIIKCFVIFSLFTITHCTKIVEFVWRCDFKSEASLPNGNQTEELRDLWCMGGFWAATM